MKFTRKGSSVLYMAAKMRGSTKRESVFFFTLSRDTVPETGFEG